MDIKGHIKQKKDRSLSLSIKDPFLNDCTLLLKRKQRRKELEHIDLKNWFPLVVGAASCFL